MLNRVIEMKQQEIKALTQDELLEHLAQQQKTYAEAKFSHSLSNLENPTQLRAQRRTIARLKTEINQRKSQEA